MDEEGDMGKHNAPVKAVAKSKGELPTAGTVNGQPQIKPDSKDPQYDHESTFGIGWS